MGRRNAQDQLCPPDTRHLTPYPDDVWDDPLETGNIVLDARDSHEDDRDSREDDRDTPLGRPGQSRRRLEHSTWMTGTATRTTGTLPLGDRDSRGDDWDTLLG